MSRQQRVMNQPVRKEHVDPGNLLLVIYLIIIAALVVIGSAFEAQGAEKKLRGLPDDISQGQLYMVESGEFLVPSPLLKENVTMSVSGIVNRVVVEQYFTNTSDTWMEAVYVFPLPEESAVDHLELLVGERKIVGIIQEKKQAKATYEKAKKEGRKASLLVQQRPNIFTTRVANIAPGESVVAKIEYQQSVHYDNGIFSLRFPMVVFPRYIPGQPLAHTEEPATGVKSGEAVSFSGEGWAADTDKVPDASQITPPVDFTGEKPINIELSVDLDAGVMLSQIRSLYHGVTTEKIATGHYRLVFTGEVKADRDFVLEWRPTNSAATSAAFFSEQQAGDNYGLLMLMPPHEKTAVASVPRELVLILDISGSMAGPSIRQAKEGVQLALQRLKPEDTFNVIVFNDQAQAFYSAPVAGTAEKVAEAISRVKNLDAEGGTEMSRALELALDGQREHSRLRQVVFLTDGAVGNEKELLQMMSGKLGDSRLFTVGIGSAPNSYFMTRAAGLGRGTFLYIGDIKEVQSRMEELFLKLENPALRNLQITTEANAALEIFPNPLPDLYYGEPLFVAIKGLNGEKLDIAGTLAGKPWQAEVDTRKSRQRPGVGVLWARKKIRSLMEASLLGSEAEEKIRQQVVALGLKHHLVTAHTSLVAVDQQISRPDKAPLQRGMVKTALPAGAQANMIFAGAPRSGTTSGLQIALGLLLLAIGLLLFGRKRERFAKA